MNIYCCSHVIKMKWTKKKIVEQISFIKKKGEPLNSYHIQTKHSALYCAIQRNFGSYVNCLELVGIDYSKINKKITKSYCYEKKLNLLKIKKEYESGKSIRSLADQYHISYRHLSTLLKKYGASIRNLNKGNYHKPFYKVNVHFFKTLNEQSTYVLGFFAADGHIHKSRNYLKFKIIDLDLLNDIKNALQTNAPISKEKNGNCYPLSFVEKGFVMI